MTRVDRQWLPETPSLDDNRAAILEVNPLAYTTAKPDAAQTADELCRRVTFKGGTSHWRLRICGFSTAQLHSLNTTNYSSIRTTNSRWQIQDNSPRGETGGPRGGTGTDMTIVTRSTYTTTNLVAATSARLPPGDPPTTTPMGLQSTSTMRTATTHHVPQIINPEDMAGAVEGTTVRRGLPRCVAAVMGAGTVTPRWITRRSAIK